MDYINKVKVLEHQFACLEVSVKDEDIVMTLLESLLSLYKYSITAMDTMPIKELPMNYIMVHLMHELSKRKENEP